MNTNKLLLDPRLKKLGEEKMDEWKKWFDSRLENAIETAEIEQQLENAESETHLIVYSFKPTTFKNDCSQ